MVTPYGRDNAFLMLGLALCLVLLALTPVPTVLAWLLAVLGFAFAAFTLWFFRDSERPLITEATTNPNVIVPPADGQVTEVNAVAHHADIGGAATQITIFLSPVNLHVNRHPVSGLVRAVRYFPGKYLMAFNPKASEENERSEVVIETSAGTVLFRQITGFLARRIVFEVVEGALVHAGDRFGMMKFGSRMDVLVPAASTVCVNVGDKVVSAHTIIARLPVDGAA